jgi:predicted PurR-regulated permease PerM
VDGILQKRGVRLTILVLVVAAGLYGAYLLSNIFAPLLFSFIVAYMLDPVADALERRRFSRLGAVVTIFLVGTLLVVTSFGIAGYYLYSGAIQAFARARGEPVFTRAQLDAEPALDVGLTPVPSVDGLFFRDELRDGGNAGTYQKSYFLLARDYVEKLGERLGEGDYGVVSGAKEWIDARRAKLESPEEQAALRERVETRVGEFLDWLAGSPVRALFGGEVEAPAPAAGAPEEEGAGVLSSVFTWASWMLLCPLYIFFLLLEIDPLVARVRGYLPGRHRERVVRIVTKIDRTMASFFRGRLTICIVKGLATAIGLMVIGVPFALPIGIAAGFLALIPYIGIWFAIIPSLVLAWFEQQSFGYVLGVGGIFFAMEILEGFWMVPTFLGKGVGLHPLTVIVTMLVFAQLLGFLGVLLSVPLAAIAKILLEEFVMPLVEEFAAEEPGIPPAGAG